MCIGMRNGNFSRYYNVDSPIHKLNPLCKILALVIFLVMVFMCSRIKVVVSLFLILMFIITISDVPFKHYFDVVYYIRFLIIILFLICLFFGFHNSCVIVGKFVMIVLYFSVLLFTTTTTSLIYGFSLLFRPLSVFHFPVCKVSMFVSLFLNFIPSLFISFDKIFRSWISRGFVSCNFSVCKSIFLSSFRRFCCSYKLMKVRNFNFLSDRNSINSYSWRFNDFYMISCHMILFVLILVKEVIL